MTKLESDIEELWDWICARIGFDKEGIELQDAIKDLIRLKIKEAKDEIYKRGRMKVIIVHNAYNNYYWESYAWCKYATKKEGRNIVKLIDNPDVIPEWCPLKTLKEAMEKTVEKAMEKTGEKT